jgi:hypothetical protein
MSRPDPISVPRVLFFTCLLLFCLLSTYCTNSIENTDKIIKDMGIPLYPDIDRKFLSIRHINSGYAVNYIAYLSYPDEAITEFYENDFLKEHFEKTFPKSYPDKRKIGKWQLSYLNETDALARKPFHAQMDNFWVNKQKGLIIWLIVFYDWRKGGDSNIRIEKNNIQNVSIYFARIKDVTPINDVDVYHFFTEEIRENNRGRP